MAFEDGGAGWQDIDMERKLQFLALASEELSASSDPEGALERVARATVQELADLCAIELVDGGYPEQVAVAHADPAMEDLARSVLTATGAASGREGPRRRALRTGEPVLMVGIAPEYWDTVATDADHASRLRALSIDSLIAVPMAARGRHLGVLTVASNAPERRFGAVHLAVARDLAGRVALAIDNARLHREAEQALTTSEETLIELERERTAERHARQAAEASADRLLRLQTITARLSRAGTIAEVADVVVDDGPGGVGAALASLSLLDETGHYLDLVRDAGFEPGVADRFSRVPVSEQLPAPVAVRTRRPVVIESLAARDSRFPLTKGAPTRNRSFVVLPLLVDDRALGALSFSWAEERRFVQDDIRFISAVADQCAQAVDRARLLDTERVHGRQLELLADASTVLSSSLDVDRTLPRLAELLVPRLADSAVVHLLDDHEVRVAAAVSADPSRQAATMELAHLASAGPADGSFVRSVAAAGEPRLIEEVTSELLAAIAEDPRAHQHLETVDVRSAVVLPLVVRGQVIGVLTMTLGPSGRRFTDTDLPVFVDLAGRAAAAIDNAGAHRLQRDVATTLQRSLLPPALPALPGLDIAARFHPVAGGSEVGGDFFDVVPIAERRWAVIMGDVCGQGVEAAALTAMVRWTARLAVTLHDAPSDVLRTVNDTVWTADTGERFCTVVVAFVERGPDVTRLVVSCAGHPLPLRVGADGVVAVGQPGTAIGLFPNPRLTDVEVALVPGDALVLYTDGVTEARSSTGAFQPDLLESVLARCDPSVVGADGVVDAVDRAILQFEGGTPRDDMAVLALVVTPTAPAS